MTKNDGLEFLREYELPTIKLLTIEEILNNRIYLKEGISVRLSSKLDNIDVNLKSIHNIHDIDSILNFIKKYSKDYDIILHKTVKPTEIGTISKYSLIDKTILVIELYNNFDERKHGIVKSRASFLIIDNQIIKTINNDFVSKVLLMELINYMKDIYYDEYNFEFIVENNDIVFTDFYSNDYKSLKKVKKI